MDLTSLQTLVQSSEAAQIIEAFAIGGSEFSNWLAPLRTLWDTGLFGEDSLESLFLLKALDWSHRKLTNLPSGLFLLRNLRELDLTENQLTTLPAEMGELSNLEELHLSYNQISI